MLPAESDAYSLIPHIWDWYIKTINHGNFSIKSYVLAISCRGDSNRSPHVILWRTSGIYAKSSFNSGLLKRFHGYGGVNIMRVCAYDKDRDYSLEPPQ